MFKWVRRWAGVPPPSRSTGTKAAPRAVPAGGKDPDPAAAPVPASAAPLPEILGEGNTQADWSAWEDSMTALDSQLQGIPPADRVHVRDTRPSQLDDPDPFSSVRRRRER